MVTKSSGEIVGTTCGIDERYSQSSLSLDECQSEAESLGYTFIYFQRADERPQNKDFCHIYWSCDTTRIPAETGTNYQLVTGNTCKAYTMIIFKFFQL